jgi:type I restriction enzyme S subunit
VDTLLGALTQSENATELADNWARLAAHFDSLFTTEQSIDKLKQTILQLAVMGRLVEQNFSSEGSSSLLQKIESKREQLVQQGKLKGSNKQCIAEKRDAPFNLPANWSWVRISELLPDFQNGASSRGDESGSEVIVLRLADITNLNITLNDPRRLLISDSSISKYAVRKGDILVIRVNGSADLVGRFIPVEAPFDGIFCDHFIRLRIDSEIIEPRFLALAGSTNLIRSRIEDLFVSTAGQKTVNQKHIGSLLTPLPPIEEQHRIVQKVDELMALCDQLTERLNLASETRCQLAEAVVEGALT